MERDTRQKELTLINVELRERNLDKLAVLPCFNVQPGDLMGLEEVCGLTISQQVVDDSCVAEDQTGGKGRVVGLEKKISKHRVTLRGRGRSK